MSQASNGEHDSAQGITRITVKGYKSLYEECSVEIRPLTILSGANSSGKSSIMQPLLLMKQTLEARYDPGYLLLNGVNVKFTSVEQFLCRSLNEKYVEDFIVKLEIDKEQILENTFAKDAEQGIKLVQMAYGSEENKLVLFEDKKFSKEVELGKVFSVLPKEYREIYEKLITETNDQKKQVDLVVKRNRCFLYHNLVIEHKLNIPLKYSGSFESSIQKIIHLSGLRGNPERTYRTTAIESDFPGNFEEYIASVINHWQVTANPHARDLEKTLESLGLTWKVAAKRIDDTQVALQVGRLTRGIESQEQDLVNIADVGFGVSQVLPVLVALLVAEQNQLVYLEQPEIHLHPRAQVILAQVLADAANRGVRVVVETHSELLLLGVQSLVAEGRLSPDKVKLHWFKRREDGVTQVQSADLDETGAFGDWHEDFGDVSLNLENRYLSAAEARLWKK